MNFTYVHLVKIAYVTLHSIQCNNYNNISRNYDNNNHNNNTESKQFAFCVVTTPFLLYKHNNYKHIEAEISLKTKHIVSIF